MTVSTTVRVGHASNDCTSRPRNGRDAGIETPGAERWAARGDEGPGAQSRWHAIGPGGGPAMSDASGSTAGLPGRDDELAALRSFLGDAQRHGAALLLTGEAGIGKTALADAAAAEADADGAWVLRTAGVEFESDLTFSALHQQIGSASCR